MRAWLHAVMLTLASLVASPAGAQSWTFGVVPQRSATLTAEYWNPLLDYVQRRSGVSLSLTLARTGDGTRRAIARGEYDFVYANQIFAPAALPIGYRVLLKPRNGVIHGQIVTLASSPITQLEQLSGQRVGFPSTSAVVAYQVTLGHLQSAGIEVEAVFGGNQEGVMAQLQTGRVVAASVNDRVLREYAHRQELAYRVLWSSPDYLDIPIAAHPRVPIDIQRAVQRAFAEMHLDPEGATLLRRSAGLIGQHGNLGFDRAQPDDYANYLRPLGTTTP